MRAAMSVVPAGVKGTTSRSGRVGQAGWARNAGVATNAGVASTARRRIGMCFLHILNGSLPPKGAAVEAPGRRLVVQQRAR